MKHLGEEVKRELGRFGPEGGISELVEVEAGDDGTVLR